MLVPRVAVVYIYNSVYVYIIIYMHAEPTGQVKPRVRSYYLVPSLPTDLHGSLTLAAHAQRGL